MIHSDEWLNSVVNPITKRPMYFNRRGAPITMLEWGVLREQGIGHDGSYGGDSYVRIAENTVGDVLVSTVWLGIDHSFGGGPPLIFESMLFGGDHDGATMRYSTEGEAVKGHREAVDDVRAGMEPWWSYGGCGNDAFNSSP